MAVNEVLGNDDYSEVCLNPEFNKLLLKLKPHLTEDGTSITVQRDLRDVEERFRQEKGTWLQQHVLLSNLKDLLLESQMRGSKIATPSSSAQFYETVQNMLTHAEIGDYIHCDPETGGERTLFGLSNDDLRLKKPFEQHSKSIQQRLIPELESRLRKRCEALVGFYDSVTDAESAKLTFARTSELPTNLEQDLQKLKLDEREIKKEQSIQETQYSEYYQNLLRSLSLLESLVKNRRLKSQVESDEVSTLWLTTRCDALCLKIKIFELQILCDTYHEGTVQALRKIRGEIDRAIHSTEYDLKQVDQTLAAYEAVGSGFDNLVQEYTRLKDEIDNKKWALRELKQHSLEETSNE
ncbi:hypothetical protein CAPTEDRAFT_198726 [Capitella teleta]|uniref:HAUS augmin-like complex subunit 4 n=1 Tax=Capitella teleta TaxID=283909 RepID=R7V2X8_CAPTE|nr:hypothetical protein CAPTEDRAFT_198726 [Capitella teleta]|eukprot:ELU12924.1 hypothetical protein CAPTEDRAFT_198726 [Capitella teleta]